MRGIHLLFATLMLFLLSSVQSQSLVPISALVGESQDTSSTSSDSSISDSDVSSSTPPTAKTTMTNIIAVSSFLTSSSISATSRSVGNAAAVGTSTGSSVSATSTPASTSGLSHQNLIIILACVLGALALIIAGALIYIFIRYRRSRSLAARGVTPIDDEEIESWRRSAQDKKSSYMHEHSRSFEKEMGSRSYMDSNTIQMSHSPGWTWTASPTSSRSHSTFYPSGISTNIPDTPRFFAQAFAQAPNARIGLTDETIPGAEPFIKPAKRQSSRLSKSSQHHSRSKSRRSSMSARSVWSVKSGHAELKANDRVATWYDPEDDFRVAKDYTESPALSSREGTPAPVTALAPRPPARPMFWDGDSRRSFWDKDPDIGEIGLAIS